jgi:hypothetical protein
VCCLLPLVYTCEYVIYIRHMLVKIPYYFFVLPHSAWFWVSVNESGFGDPPVWFWVCIITRTGVRGGFGFCVWFWSAKAPPDPN